MVNFCLFQKIRTDLVACLRFSRRKFRKSWGTEPPHQALVKLAAIHEISALEIKKHHDPGLSPASHTIYSMTRHIQHNTRAARTITAKFAIMSLPASSHTMLHVALAKGRQYTETHKAMLFVADIL